MTLPGLGFSDLDQPWTETAPLLRLTPTQHLIWCWADWRTHGESLLQQWVRSKLDMFMKSHVQCDQSKLTDTFLQDFRVSLSAACWFGLRLWFSTSVLLQGLEIEFQVAWIELFPSLVPADGLHEEPGLRPQHQLVQNSMNVFPLPIYPALNDNVFIPPAFKTCLESMLCLQVLWIKLNWFRLWCQTLSSPNSPILRQVCWAGG